MYYFLKRYHSLNDAILLFLILFMSIFVTGCLASSGNAYAIGNIFHPQIIENPIPENSPNTLCVNKDKIYSKAIFLGYIKYQRGDVKYSWQTLSKETNDIITSDFQNSDLTVYLLIKDPALKNYGNYQVVYHGNKYSPFEIYGHYIDIYAFDWRTKQFLGSAKVSAKDPSFNYDYVEQENDGKGVILDSTIMYAILDEYNFKC